MLGSLFKTLRAQVILVNGETASTSEMLTGALHAAGRAVTAGAHTFGKGRTQRVMPMRDGSTLLVSASLITTPAHERIDKARRPAPAPHMFVLSCVAVSRGGGLSILRRTTRL